MSDTALLSPHVRHIRVDISEYRPETLRSIRAYLRAESVAVYERLADVSRLHTWYQQSGCVVSNPSPDEREVLRLPDDDKRKFLEQGAALCNGALSSVGVAAYPLCDTSTLEQLIVFMHERLGLVEHAMASCEDAASEHMRSLEKKKMMLEQGGALFTAVYDELTRAI